MYLADALSRAYPEDSVSLSIPQPEFCHVLEQLELVEHLPISTKRLKQIQEATIADLNLQVLQETILTGWPSNKSQIPSEIKPYMKCRDELTMQDGILYLKPGYFSDTLILTIFCRQGFSIFIF